MKKFFLALLMVIAVASLFVGSATADTTTDEKINDSQVPPNATGQLAESDTLTLYSIDYHPNSKTATLRIGSDRHQAVLFVEAGTLENTGSLRTHSVPLEEGIQTVRVPAGEVGAYAGLTVSSNDGFFVVSKQIDRTYIGGPYDVADMRNVGIGASIGISVAVLYTAISARLGLRERGERVA